MIGKSFRFATIFLCTAALTELSLLSRILLVPYFGPHSISIPLVFAVFVLSVVTGSLVGLKSRSVNSTLKIATFLPALAGGWICMIPQVRDRILVMLDPIGVNYAAVLTVAGIEVIPTVLIVGSLVSLVVQNESLSGSQFSLRSSMLLVPMVTGVIAGGTVLLTCIPRFGSASTVVSSGGLLISSATLWYLIRKPGATGSLILVVCLASFVTGVLHTLRQPQRSTAIAYMHEGIDEDVRVVTNQGTIYVLVNGGLRGAVDSVTYDSREPYTSMLELPMFLRPRGSALIIGLGNGALYKNYSALGWKTTVSEDNAAIIDIAGEYFGVTDAHDSVLHLNGREILTQRRSGYDLIIIDERDYAGISPHMLTLESIALAKQHLQDSGIVAVNLETVGWDDILVKSVVATLKFKFRNVIVLPEAEPPSEYGNVVVLASDSSLALQSDLPRNTLDPNYRFSGNYWKVHGWDNQYAPETAGAPVLTDAMNPAVGWMTRIGGASRTELHRYLAGVRGAW